MADISSITILDGVTYTFKDAEARELLNGHSIRSDVPANAKFTDITAYQIRGNLRNHKMKDQSYGYRLFFTSADRNKWVPANTNANASAETVKTPNTSPIDPFGPIVYYTSAASINANAIPLTENLWDQHLAGMGYSFNTTGSAISFTINDPVYIKCTPQSDGSAILQGYTQTLPNTNDGFIYIYVGIGMSLGMFELELKHPVYYHDGTGVRLWTGKNTLGFSFVKNV